MLTYRQWCIRPETWYAFNGPITLRTRVGLAHTPQTLLILILYDFVSYYGACILSILNAFALQGFLTMNCVIGGQTLASVSENMSWNIGIIIIALIALMVTPNPR